MELSSTGRNVRGDLAMSGSHDAGSDVDSDSGGDDGGAGGSGRDAGLRSGSSASREPAGASSPAETVRGAGGGDDPGDSGASEETDGALRRRRGSSSVNPVRAFLAKHNIVKRDGGTPAFHPSAAGPMRTVSYDLYDSELWNWRKEEIRKEEEEEDGRCSISHQTRCRLFRRLAIFGIGVVTAVVAYFISWCIDNLEKSYLRHLGTDGAGTAMSTTVYGRYVGFSLLFSVASFVPIAFVRPVAAGSGIAEAKTVLNGIKIPRCTELLSAACKGVSVMFSVASSLPSGLEGPLIFIGMVIGENAYCLIPRRYVELRSWRMRRDLAAVGTAAGVSAAFLSPIGGILFAAEEGASYITAGLLSQCFGAAITVIIFEYFFSVIRQGAFGLEQPFAQHLASFNGRRGHTEKNDPLFSFIDYFVIVLVGAVGGLMGACFVEASKFLSRLRRRYVRNAWKKFAEVIVLTVVATTLLSWLPTIPAISSCKKVEYVHGDPNYFLKLNCGEDEYNELGTLLRNPMPAAINLLFWEGTDTFSSMSCLVAGTTMLLLLLFTFGASISLGIFVPLLYVGAAFGRAWAALFPDRFNVHTYAIVGATASLNGVARVLVSLTVIMIETTNLATFASPLMVVCLASRWVGNSLFGGEGIYDEIIKMRGIPFLEAEPPEVTKREVLRARDIMSHEFSRLDPVVRIADILLTLRQNHHLDFVVTDDGGVLVGSISRTTLITIIWDKKPWHRDISIDPESLSHASMLSPPQTPRVPAELSYDKLQFDHLENITNEELLNHFSDDDDKDGYQQSLDITPYMTLAPITFSENGSAERAYELFRTHGLRQLIVIDEKELKPVGVITRHVILKELEGEDATSTQESENRSDMDELQEDSLRVQEEFNTMS